VARPITFLSDYGYADEFAGVCRAVIARIAPDAKVIDITHGLPRHAVRQGAVLLANALPFTPPGVHLAIVDPGVGTERRPVAVRVADEERLLVGPDNGVLALAAKRLGGGVEALDLSASPHRLEPITSTFHGRDLFAPVAAHLAAGVAFSSLGPQLQADEIVDLRLPDAVARDGGLDTAVLFIDTFGNCRLAGQADDLERVAGALQPAREFAITIEGRRSVVPWAATFGAVAIGSPLLYEDADYAGLAIGVNQGSAAERFGLEIDRPIRLEPT